MGFSALQRAEIAEIPNHTCSSRRSGAVSVLFNEPKLLKSNPSHAAPSYCREVSVLFNEPKLLKSPPPALRAPARLCFSALQRAEIAEILRKDAAMTTISICFSALQRAEIAEMRGWMRRSRAISAVSVLFNEPKLLKFSGTFSITIQRGRFSALQRAEIAEISSTRVLLPCYKPFQCSSTSRNC